MCKIGHQSWKKERKNKSQRYKSKILKETHELTDIQKKKRVKWCEKLLVMIGLKLFLLM